MNDEARNYWRSSGILSADIRRTSDTRQVYRPGVPFVWRNRKPDTDSEFRLRAKDTQRESMLIYCDDGTYQVREVTTMTL